MQAKNLAIGIVVVVATLLGAYFIFSVSLPQGSFSTLFTNEQKPSELKSYTSEELKIAFQYKAEYLLEERTVNEAQRLHKAVVLVEDNETNRKLLSGEIVGDGPTAITVDVFQNNLDKQTAENFIKNSSNSNYKMGDGELEEGILSGLQAYRYTWDGLYRGESIVAANDDYVYMFSVTYLEPTDKIRSDFYEMLATLELK